MATEDNILLTAEGGVTNLSDRIDTVTNTILNAKENLRQAIIAKSSTSTPPSNPTFEQLKQGISGITYTPPSSFTIKYSNYKGEEIASGENGNFSVQTPTVSNFEHNIGHPLYSQYSYLLNGSSSYRIDLKSGLYSTFDAGVSPSTVDGDLDATLPWGSAGLAVIFSRRLSREKYPIYFFNLATNTSSLLVTFTSNYDASIGWSQIGAYDTTDSILYLHFNDFNANDSKAFRLSVDRNTSTITTIASGIDSGRTLNGCTYTNLGLIRFRAQNNGYGAFVEWKYFANNSQIDPTTNYTAAFEESEISGDYIIEYFISSNKNLLLCSSGTGMNLYNKTTKTKTILVSGVAASYSLGGYLDNSSGLIYVGFLGVSTENNYYSVVYQSKFNLPITPKCTCKFNKIVYKGDGSSIAANTSFTSGNSHYTTEQGVTGTVRISTSLVVS